MKDKQHKVIVLGAGISGLAAAITAADNGNEVLVIDNQTEVGGRARTFERDGFVFDMGPSWYWMPDVFEKFFNRFGKKVSDYYALKRLDPSYKVFFPSEIEHDIPADKKELEQLFEQIEKGSAEKLNEFMEDAAYKYEQGMQNLVYQPSLSMLEFAKPEVLKGLQKMQLIGSFTKELSKYFSDNNLQMLMKFPVLFLGAKPEKTPALYSLMNYADMELGTWYPEGGMSAIPLAMKKLALEKGVEFKLNTIVQKLNVGKKEVKEVITDSGTFSGDWIISSADYHHTEKLLSPSYRNYDEAYWDKKTFAPSCLLFFVGVNKKIEGLKHHNLFFDTNFDAHAETIYDTKTWPKEPMFYTCCPSKTDDDVAPEGKENLFILFPVAAGLEDINDKEKEKYFKMAIERMENRTGCKFAEDVLFHQSFSINDFKDTYNSYKGNAYGLANTLMQTAFLRPKIKNKKIKNLFYTGQLTVPGPGVPPALISGQIVSDYIDKLCRN